MKTLLTIFFIFFFLAGWTQSQKRIIADKESGKPVPYATVKVLNTSRGQIASVNGEFTLNIEAADTVLITSVGYHDALLTGNELTSAITLIKKPRLLDNVIAQAKKVLRNFTIGLGADLIAENTRCKYKPGREGDCVPWGPGAKAEFAEPMTLLDSSKTYRLSKVYLPLEKHGCWQPMFFHVYALDSMTGNPGEMIYQKYVTPEAEKYSKSKVILDLKNENIYFSNTSRFFISVSWDTEFSDKDCLTTLYLLKSLEGLSYTRTIHSPEYRWFLLDPQKLQNREKHLHTVFAAEVEEVE